MAIYDKNSFILNFILNRVHTKSTQINQIHSYQKHAIPNIISTNIKTTNSTEK
jgi:hypothetical protein